MRKINHLGAAAALLSAVLTMPSIGGAQVFVDHFNNGSVSDSDTIPGFWNTVVGGTGVPSEAVGGPMILKAQSSGPGDPYPFTQISSGLNNSFNFFRSPVVLKASGLGYANGDFANTLTQFDFTSEALNGGGGPGTEYAAEDGISLVVGNTGFGSGNILLGLKLDSPNHSTPFDRYQAIGPNPGANAGKQTYAGQVRGFSLTIAATFYDLIVYHDTSPSDPTQLTNHYAGGLNVFRGDYSNWGTPTNPAGDSALNIETQLSNVSSATPVANFKIGQVSVDKFQQTWQGASLDNWSNSASWSDPTVLHPNGDGSTSNVPNFVGANVKFAQAAGPVTVIADHDETLGAIIFDSTQPYTLTVNGGGEGTLHMASRYLQSEVHVIKGNHTIFNPMIFHVGSDALVTVDLANSTLTAPYITLEDQNNQVLTKEGAGTLATTKVNANTVLLNAGKIRMIANDGSPAGLAAGLSSINNLTISSGLLDLTNNDLKLPNANLSDVRAAVANWYAGGARTGSGIGSSLSTAGSYTTLAVVSNDVGNGIQLFTNFDGAPVSGSDILVKYTYTGDTNLDGKIDGNDIAAVIEAYSTGLTGWQNGDTNYDGVVNAVDVQAVLAAFANQGGAFPDSGAGGTTGGGSIPEPSALSAGVVLMGVLGRRRR